MYRKNTDSLEKVVIYFALSILCLSGNSVTSSLFLQFLLVGLGVLFGSAGMVAFYHYRKITLGIIEHQKKQTRSVTEKLLEDKTSIRLFQIVLQVLSEFKTLTAEQRNDFLWWVPQMFDLNELKYKDKVYTVTQAKLVLFHQLEQKHGSLYLPVIRKHKTSQRVWLSALENDLIECGSAQRNHATDRAYLVDTPEQAFLKLYNWDETGEISS